jgi:hypothetical protein
LNALSIVLEKYRQEAQNGNFLMGQIMLPMVIRIIPTRLNDWAQVLTY